ncbi:MAG TPA: deoxyribose-phosphate aldolase [Planctomycetota bacterium]|nr:deoxyribose-phosphate aldolase [Planctomycetota bacterium]
MSHPLAPVEFRVPPVDAVALETRAAELATRSIKKQAKVQGLRLCVSMMDLTTLEGMDSPGKVRQLCEKAKRPLPGRTDVPPCAAVCVYPDLVEVAVAALRGSGVQVASVATGFPSGRTDRPTKLREVQLATADGATEIDMVIDRGAFLSGRYGQVYDEICAVKEACGGSRLKVILETGELGTYDNVRRAGRIALLAGADFLKTSTGKVAPASTLPVVLLLLEAVRDHYLETGHMVGVKAAGGIRTAKDALRYLVLVAETCGDLWLEPNWFRFGASSLLNDVLMQLEKERTGRYQRPADFSVD